MAPPVWALSIPLGVVNLLYPRLVALYLQVRSGVALDNTMPRNQVESKEVAMKDPDG